jgi:dienelactone hydrolase
MTQKERCLHDRHEKYARRPTVRSDTFTHVRRLLILGLVLGAVGCGGGGDEDASSPKPTVASTTTTTVVKQAAEWTAVATPKNGGAGAGDIKWFRSADGQYAAVGVPEGPGPFPTVVYYHGRAGMFFTTTAWMSKLVDAGYAVVAGCWNPGVEDALVQCPGSMDESAATQALFEFAKTVPGVDADRMASMGLSAGAGPAFSVPPGQVQAVVIDSGTDAEVSPDLAPGLEVPILVLSSKRDEERVADIQRFVDRIKAAGADTKAVVYPDGGHAVTNQGDTTDAATAEIVAFLNEHLAA